MRTAFLIPLLWLVLLFAARAETLPPKPANYFNDYANAVSRSTATQLNDRLRQFERESSNQIVVAVFPKMNTESSIADYCQRIFQSWKVGQAKLNNGAVLFVFVQDRQMRIQTGYGLEGALPDILCKQIIENEIVPRFKNRDFDGGLSAGIDAMIKATRGEYKGNGHIHSEPATPSHIPTILVAIILIILVIKFIQGLRGGTVYSSRGSYWDRGGWGGGGWGGGGWGGGGGGGFSGGDGGGFSGGGGSSGGGGASGSW